jgi:hypothetical protein
VQVQSPEFKPKSHQKKEFSLGTRGMTQVVECLPTSKHKALSLNPSTTKKRVQF